MNNILNEITIKKTWLCIGGILIESRISQGKTGSETTLPDNTLLLLVPYRYYKLMKKGKKLKVWIDKNSTITHIVEELN